MPRARLAAAMLAFALGALACSAKERHKFEESRPLMGTSVSITVFCEDGQQAAQAFEAAFERIARLEALLSDYRPESEISRLNAAGGRQVKVSPETFAVLERAVEFGTLSGGAFDVTVRPLVSLWRKAEKDGALPSPRALKTTLSLVGYQGLLLDAASSSAGIGREGRVDVGGIAKGFIVGEAVRALQARGITRALVVAGGDMYALGAHPEHGRWLIGIRDPLKPDDNIRYVEVADRAVATSAHYMRFYSIQGKTYSHIFDPRTGMPVDNKVASVTVIGEDGTAADALSTSVAVLGPEKGLALVRSFPGYEALVMTWDGSKLEFLQTPAFGRYLRPE